ncbi:hypothetical protein DFA_05104 [Cavenderia fasciculata]|uniref:Uncharacterized protein n=1 Tax=Cavenderia fasciculata TaxID=261658 RepID=F4PNC1_CACFS|nr:uncharacterized protein DFA_05104 [Cavenderia fasciculata]EGG22974.1 hypothetical protein DFA_05104 [Cavenderia fasciculata]|eukprot:XP_004360825.1 hypothetical protein DFA_05104 [Cavenderia fasciculata]
MSSKEEELFRKIIGSVTLRTTIFNHVREIRMLLGTTFYKIPGTKYTVELCPIIEDHQFIIRKYAMRYQYYFYNNTKAHTFTLGALDTITGLLQNSVSKLVKRSIQLMSLENVNDGGSAFGSGGGLRCKHLALSLMELFTHQEAADYGIEMACEAVDKYHIGESCKEPYMLYVYQVSHIIEKFKSAAAGGNANFGNLYTTTVVFFHRIIEYILHMIANPIACIKKRRNSTTMISSQEVKEILKGEEFTSGFFFRDELEPPQASATLGLDSIKFLEKIKETDQLYTEDPNEAINTIYTFNNPNDDDNDDDDDEGYNQPDFGQLVVELPIENLRTIAKMLSVDIQECLDKKNVIKKKIMNEIKQLTSKKMIFKMYEDDGDVDASQYSETDLIKICRWYECMCDNDGYHDVWFMTPVQAFKEFGDPKELKVNGLEFQHNGS